MSERIPPHGRQLPEEYREDMHPQAGADENVHPSDRAAPEYRTAYDDKAVHDRLSEFSDDDLKRIPIVPEGTRLRQGATYTELLGDERVEFTATAEITAKTHERFVAKSDVDHELWDLLLGRGDRPPVGG